MKNPLFSGTWQNSPWSDSILNSNNNAVIITDPHFHIVKWNKALEQLLHEPTDRLANKNIIDILEEIHYNTNGVNQKLLRLVETGALEEDIILNDPDGNPIHLFCHIHKIPGTDKVAAIVIIIQDLRKQIQAIHSSDSFYKTLLDTLYEGVLLVTGNKGTVLAGNKRAWEILKIKEANIVGYDLLSTNWQLIHEDGSALSHHDSPALSTLNTGKIIENTVIGIKRPSGKTTWLSVKSSPFNQLQQNLPLGAVVSFSDVTEEKNAQEAFRRSNERFAFVLKAISDCIWDWNIETGEIYRSESLTILTGHTEKSIENNQNWWFEKIHPDDRESVKNNINSCLENGIEHWNDEYRFLCADNKYKYIIDKGYIVHKDGKPVRAIGAVQDVTETKNLEARLQLQKSQQQKEVNRAIITTQDYERNELGKELHDNVNQILATASLYLKYTKVNNGEGKEEYLEKSHEYIHMAIEDLRKISKSLNTSVVEQFGLISPVQEIAVTLRLNKNLTVLFDYNDSLEKNLTSEQKLMMYRIIQEQTTNIIKYAEASEISITINKKEKSYCLIIADNGKGFDTTQSCKGIGLANMRNRAEAFNGTMSIKSAPGKGCSLKISVPLAG